MDGLTLLHEAAAAGLTVRADGDTLVIRGPKRAEAVARLLLAHKPDVMSALAVSSASTQPETTAFLTIDDAPSRLLSTRRGYLLPCDLPERWREMYEERAAIREFHGEQAREHAEAEALAEVLKAMEAEGEHTQTKRSEDRLA